MDTPQPSGYEMLCKRNNFTSFCVDECSRAFPLPIRKVETSPSLPKAQGGRVMRRDEKVMLPAPQPSTEYLTQAAGQPTVVIPASPKLVILDLNGTLLYRPNRKQPTKMIGRPFLAQFLEYLFSNFSVMVWSSARPQNVKVLVENGLGKHQDALAACWARDTYVHGKTLDEFC